MSRNYDPDDQPPPYTEFPDQRCSPQPSATVPQVQQQYRFDNSSPAATAEVQSQVPTQNLHTPTYQRSSSNMYNTAQDPYYSGYSTNPRRRVAAPPPGHRRYYPAGPHPPPPGHPPPGHPPPPPPPRREPLCCVVI